MKRILFIAPHSYPIKSSESICNSKVAYTLAKAGYEVDVFTCSDPSTYPADKDIDNLLSNSPNLQIITVKGEMLTRAMSPWKLLKGILRYTYIYLKTGYFYNGLDYSFQIVKAIKKRIAEKNGIMPYDIMITRGFNTDYAGLYMHKKYGLKWIANWNDPYPTKRFPAPYGQGFNAPLSHSFQKLYDEMQMNAQIHTFPSDRLRKYMLKCFTHVNAENTRVIHHMAHSDIKVNKNNIIDDCFYIVHSGWVKHPRNPRHFLEALSNVVKQIKQKIKCIFIGGYDSNIESIVKEFNLENIIEFKSSMTYSESLNFTAKAHLSLIIEAECEEGIYLPTKFVDAMQSHTPVFCVSPKNGTLRDLTEKYHVGYACDNSNVKSIEKSLILALNDYSEGKLPIISEKTASVFFDKHILKQYEMIFEELTTTN